ncbi:MAG TPA: DNA polymerase Y family protein [Rhizomicrobium sp.]|nr:DNA polymerase Y family protein [Rhizomicrobium sp.]
MASSARRTLALWFPRLPTDRLQRRAKASSACSASPERPPLVIVAKIDNALRLSALDRKAASLGLRPGMPLANARAMLPALDVASADETADRGLLESIADWCEHFTPLVALDPPHGLLLDITGAAHLFGGEETLLARICVSLSKQGFAVQGAIAGSMVAAHALARYRNGAIIAPGEEAGAVAPLPVEALDLDAAMTHAFRHAGLKTIGQVAARKRSELTARFGAAMVFALDQTLGHAEKPISPRAALPDYSAERIFAEPVTAEEVILETLRTLAASLGGLLAERGEGARRMEAIFFRADGVVRRLAVETGGPTRDVAIIARLFRERLDALVDPLDPGFGFDLIRLCADRAERCEAGTSPFDARANEEKEIAFLVDRLAARFGAQRILSFRPNDTHIPEAASVALPAQSAENCTLPWKAIRGRDEAPRRPLRLFARPEPIDAVAEVPDGPPLRFRWRRALHEVAFAEGPERIAMEWWRQETPQPTRDYYRVEDSKGRRFWLYRDGLYHRETDSPLWFLHGLFA